MFFKRESTKKEENTDSRIITEDDELKLILDMKKTKEQYETALSELKSVKKELNDVLKQAHLLLKDMKSSKE